MLVLLLLKLITTGSKIINKQPMQQPIFRLILGFSFRTSAVLFSGIILITNNFCFQRVVFRWRYHA